MEAIITVGISASGKSTWAREFIEKNPNWFEINRDQLRWNHMGESGIQASWKNWKWKWEDKITATQEAFIKWAAENNKNIIISDTNLSRKTRDGMTAKLQALGYEITLKFFPVSWDEAVKRDNARADGVGYAVLQKQWQDWLDLMQNRPDQNPELPKAVIVDIDGTVAKMNNNRGPFEWHKVLGDVPNEPVCEMVRGLRAAGNFILFTSGRDGICREHTLEWILREFPTFKENADFNLLMRPIADQRKDTEIKKEIFYNDILPNYFVRFAIDDRPCIVRLWLDLGIPVAAVGNPYVEF